MSTPDHNPIPAVKPVGNTEDPRGFYQLLVAHITWLAVHNFSNTTLEKRALYVKALASWCIDCDLTSPLVITKPILEAFQRHLFGYRKSDGKPLAWSSQHLHLKELRQFFSWLAKQNYGHLRRCNKKLTLIPDPRACAVSGKSLRCNYLFRSRRFMRFT